MKPINPGNRLTPFLLVVCALLAGILALQQSQGVVRVNTPPKTKSTDPASDSEVVPTRFIAPQMASFGEILERPLFAPSRKPPEPPETKAPVVQGPPSRFKLEGVAITPEARVAVIRDLNRNELSRLLEGATHNGWLVESVSPEGARLTKGTQSQELTLAPDEMQKR